jgi:hypothetical protein
MNDSTQNPMDPAKHYDVYTNADLEIKQESKFNPFLGLLLFSLVVYFTTKSIKTTFLIITFNIIINYLFQKPFH